MQKFKVYFWKGMPSGYFKVVKDSKKDRMRDYMNVYLCETSEEMYNLVNKLEKKEIERDYSGRTFCYNRNFYDIESDKYIKTSPLCGYIAICKEYLYQDVISHESTHAVIGYFNRKLKEYQKIFTEIDEFGNILGEEVPPEEDLEELFCYMVGSISDQIACNQNKLKGDG